jgi:hypothetical protein
LTGENTPNSHSGPGLGRDPPGGLAGRNPGRWHQHCRIKYDGDRHHRFGGSRFNRLGFLRVGWIVRVLRHLELFQFFRFHRLFRILGLRHL